MTVVLTGDTLTLEELVRVARGREHVEIDRGSMERVAAARAVVEEIVAEGVPAYGLTTAVGARKRYVVTLEHQVEHNRLMIETLRIGQGPEVTEEVVRATILRLANGFALGTAGVRPALLERLVDVLNDGVVPSVRRHGSIGMADIVPLAELSKQLFEDFPLAAKEAVSLVDNNAFSTALAALAIHDLERLLDAFEVVAALDMEAFAANVSILHPYAAEVRPHPGVGRCMVRLTELLVGSSLWEEGTARNLQDPLTWRCIPQIHGSARDALAYGQRQLAIELNASQENPLVVLDEKRIVSVGSFDPIGLAASLDFMRIALAPVISAACERLVKLMQQPLSGLATGLTEHDDFATTTFPQFPYIAAALAGEARLLAGPVSFELPTGSISEGIEDRVTMAPLAARRLSEMVELGERVAAIGLAVAAQAIDLRAPADLGVGSAQAYAAVRARPGRHLGDVEPLVDLVRSGELGGLPQ